MTQSLTFFATAALLAGCAAPTAPPLTAAHPASPDAREGAHLARRTSLRTDELTRQTHKQLSAAQREQEHWDKHGPVSGTPENEQKPEMKHDH